MDPDYLVILFLFLILLKWILTPSTNMKKNIINLPPSPLKIPIIGHLHRFGRHPHRSFISLSRRHGPIMLLNLGTIPIVVISSAAAAKEIIKTHDLTFSARPKSKIVHKLFYNLKSVSAAPYGDYWRRLKTICVLQLLSNHRVNSFSSVREEEIFLMIQKIEESKGKNIPVNLTQTFSKISNDVVCRAAFGKKFDDGEKWSKLSRLLVEFLLVLGNVSIDECLPWLGWINKVTGRDAAVDRVVREMDDFLESVIEEKIKEIAERKVDHGHGGRRGEDFVDILLSNHMTHEHEDGVIMSIDRDTVKGTILDIFSAGTTSSSSILEWAMTELLRHPKVMKELQNEVRKVGNGKSMLTEEDMENTVYMRAVIKETLRYHTPIPLLPRVAREDVNVMGYDIAANTIIFINTWGICRDPLLWDDPEMFKPERFLNSSVDYNGQDFEMIPFGAGRRGCPGISFVIAINELALANLIYRFNWELGYGKKGEDLDVEESTGFIVHRKNNLMAVAT